MAIYDLLRRNVYLVKEHVGLFRVANNFDILDSESGDIIVECLEESWDSLQRS
jgi:hypothetical protein